MKSVMLVTGELQENCYIVWDDPAQGALVFDPGWDAHNIQAVLAEHRLVCAAIVLTHCHGDHIGAVIPLKEKFPAAPLHCPEAEVEWLQRPTLNLSYFYGFPITTPPPEVIVRDGDTLNLAGFTLKAIHVPGHSPGGTAYFIEHPRSAPHLYCGDILFAGSIGRTDLPGGQGEEVLVEGIRTRLFPLPNETIVHPGHGPETTLGAEKADNPYCGLE